MNKKRIVIALALLVVIIIASIFTYTLYQSNNKKQAEKKAGYSMTNKEADGFNEYLEKPEKLTTKAEQDIYLAKLKELKDKIDSTN